MSQIENDFVEGERAGHPAIKMLRSSAITGRIVSVAILSVIICLQALGKHLPPPSVSDQKISVRISAKRMRVEPGQNLVLNVEIRNEGSKSVFIAKDIQGPDNALTAIQLSLYYDGEVEHQSVFKVVDDFSSNLADSPSAPPLSSILSENWVPLAPSHSYGGDVVMLSSNFSHLSIPGRYRIQGKYTSRGFMADDVNNPLAEYFQQLQQLPFGSWVGEVDTNSIWIEVVKPTKKPSRIQ
jgi:hypothetical protein